MSQQEFKELIAGGRLICPTCSLPVRSFEKYTEMASSVWDGAGDTSVETAGSKVTLICANGECPWRERTEYWSNYLKD
jgi:hypothetical protein